MNFKAIAAAAGVVAFALSLMALGCGSSEPTPLSRAAFSKQANSICKEAMNGREASLTAAAKSASKSEGSSEAEVAKLVVEVALPPVQDMAEDLDGLGSPVKDEKQVEAMIAALENGVEKSEEAPLRAVSGITFSRANDLAVAYGLNECVV